MTIVYFILAALALGILVFFHELGHYFMAKWTGMIVEVFSIGFGKPIVKWRWGGVQWQVGWLPFGGYVKIKGMEVSKKDHLEPHEIPDGFFSKSPLKRILVAIAGPLANFILAFFIFVILWSMGGREKPFSEFTQIVGWVDPASELYANGVRPGDLLTEYDGKPFESSKDLLYAAMLGDREVELKGYHVNYATDKWTPFTYKIPTYQMPGSLDGILTTGVTAGARYLIYNTLNGSPNPLPEGSPMDGSGLKLGDRLVWADGELLFSMDQLSHVLSADKALLTVQRSDEIFLTRQPRVGADDLVIPPHVRDELTDWQHEVEIKGPWQDLKILPYVLSAEGIVEAPLPFIDAEAQKSAFPAHPYNPALQEPLQPKDRVIAIDGKPVSTAYELLDHLQTHHVVLMAEEHVGVDTKIPWREEDLVFMESIRYQQIQKLAAQVGQGNEEAQFGHYKLLKPIQPLPLEAFTFSAEAQAQIEAQYTKQREEIEAISDQEKRTQALAYLDEIRQKPLLGVALQDRRVDYNPKPFALFGSVFTETYHTLKALIFGYLHPKWISGPVGIVQVIHQGWKMGIGEALFWIGAISVNLGFLNLLPIPVLDGGYICLSLWELITRRRLKAKTMERLIIPFVVLLIALLVFLTFQDISRFF